VSHDLSEVRARIFSSTGEGWGLFDTADNCWMGDLSGPTVYRDGDIAAIGGSLLAHELDLPSGRLEVRRYDGSGNKLKDEVAKKQSAKGLLARLERGTVVGRVGRPAQSSESPSSSTQVSGPDQREKK
jgi:hypothetical protein